MSSSTSSSTVFDIIIIISTIIITSLNQLLYYDYHVKELQVKDQIFLSISGKLHIFASDTMLMPHVKCQTHLLAQTQCECDDPHVKGRREG